MRNYLCAVACLCALVGVRAENLLLNGALEADQVDVPTFWRVSNVDGATPVVACRSSGGPSGGPSVRFYNPPGSKMQNAELRQYDMTLLPGGRYRLSAWIRTKDLIAQRFGVLVANARWRRSDGVGRCERDSAWHKVEAEIDMFDSADGLYSFVVFLRRFTGELEVADLSLEPLDERSRAGSRPSAAGSAAFKPRIFPWKPLLADIDPDDRTMTFRFVGNLPDGVETASVHCVLSCAGEAVRSPLSEMVRFALPTKAPESGRLRVALVGNDGSEILANDYSYRVRKHASVDCSTHRVLNNFVTEVLSAKTETRRQTFRFSMPRDGWVVIAVGAKEGVAAELDGHPVIEASWTSAETFRNISRGNHELVVLAPVGSRILVRSVVETLNYPPCVNSPIKENPPYDWDFFCKHVMRSTTTQCGGMIPLEHQAEFRSHGGEWLSNFVQMKALRRSEDMPGMLMTSSRFTDDCYDGTTIDEFFLGSADTLERYTGGLKLFSAVDSGLKKVYTWVIGKPGTDGLSREFYATSANASRGRGKVLIEVYCRSKPTEEVARAYLKTYFADTLEKCRACYPEAQSATGLILGNFNQMPLICAVHHPEVDMKYYLDLQLNYLANDPAFKGLGCTGYWGSYYGDHEMHRWSMALLRHYCVKGRRDMLSDRYGYAYIPGHLTNGDFRGTFEAWQVTGDIRLDEAEGLAGRSEARWGGTGGVGDTFALFVRGQGTNRLEQTICGLVPGRAYCLQAATFDAKDVHAVRVAPRKIPLTVTLSAAQILPDLTWVHVDNRTKLSSKHLGARINLHHIVFRASSPTARVVIDDALAAPGEELGVNAVSVNPYYEEKQP